MAMAKEHVFIPGRQFFPDVLEAKLQGEICHNVRIKEYPQGIIEVLTATRPVFREPGYESDQVSPRSAPASEPGPDKQRENVLRAVRRAKVTLRDLAMCNDMRYFVTLTLAADKVDRYDMRAIMRKVNAWCSNQVQRKGLAYILVPELHKDGAVHFHGFVNDAVGVVDSGTLSVPWSKRPRKPRSVAQRADWLAKGGQPVYNLPAWTIGYTTAIPLYGPIERAISYCCKYVGKQIDGGGDDLPSKIGGRWFLHGGCKHRPEVSYADVDLADFVPMDGAYEFGVEAARCTFVREFVSL